MDVPLAPGERVVARLERNLTPYWMMLAVAGMGIIVATVEVDVFGWGIFLVGVVALAFVGSMVSSMTYTVTDRRVVRTGWLGRREVALGKLAREPGAFGETVVAVGRDGATMRVRHVKNASDCRLTPRDDGAGAGARAGARAGSEAHSPVEGATHIPRPPDARPEDIPMFTLPDLPYAHDALEPAIDKTTMEIHHGRHHKAYVDNLNKAVEGKPEWANKQPWQLCMDIASAPKELQAPLRNNGGGHWNHTHFWNVMAPKGKTGSPSPELARKIDQDLGGMDKMKEAVNDAGVKRFGSGWAWVILGTDGHLHVASTPNQDNPLMKGIVDPAATGTPLLGVDVWEHAYYLKYQNKRADYLKAWWDVVNWNTVSQILAQASQHK